MTLCVLTNFVIRHYCFTLSRLRARNPQTLFMNFIIDDHHGLQALVDVVVDSVAGCLLLVDV